MPFAVRPVGAAVADDLPVLILPWVDGARAVALLFLSSHLLPLSTQQLVGLDT